MTTAEYLLTPESLYPTELAYGVLTVNESPSVRHQGAVKDFLLALNPFVEEHRLGELCLSPLDVILDAERALIVQPDLLFISNEREHILQDRVMGAPDMVLEVLSPNPRVGDLSERLRWFARYGVRECWVLRLLERRLDVLTCADGAVASRISFAAHEPVASTVFEGFSRSLNQILRSRWYR